MKKIFIGFVWLVAFCLIVISFIRSEQWLLNGTLTLGWVLFAIQMTVSHFEKVYLFLKRIWFEVSNPECIWSFQVTYNGEFNRDTLLLVEHFFLENQQDVTVTNISNIRKLFRMGTLSLEVYLDEELKILRFSIHDMEISYRRSKSFIEDRLASLFESLQLKLKPDSGAFDLTINFNDYNPYFGFYVRRLNAGEVQRFNVIFRIDNDRVSVGKNQIEINTQSLQHMRSLSKKYIVLSPAK